ncbi:MAG: hypothetical protein FGM43_05575 [Sinobacteraceae bacterium]|nr:hypothetical protein [Nevskiaceae bacterium]
MLAVYMLGLALGAAIIPRWLRAASGRSLRTFALLELGIAACAVLIPLLLAQLGEWYVAIAGDLPAPPSATGLLPRLYFALTCLLLLVPTMLMGATLPVLAGFAIRVVEQTGPRIATLYAANTLGAAAGALAGGWWLIPDLGLRQSTLVAIALNLLVVVIAYSISKNSERAQIEAYKAQAASRVAPAGSSEWHNRRALLMLAMTSGFVALTYEVLWTRMLSHALGSSLAAFSTMLATFLLGISLGSLLSTRRLTRPLAGIAYATSQLCVAAAAAGAQLWLGQLATGLNTTELATRAIIAMLPATLFMGAAFPLLIRLMSDHGVESARATGQVYAFNTIGAVCGALASGMWLIPTFSFEGVARFAVALSLIAAVVATWRLTTFVAWHKSAVSAAALILIVAFRPPLPAAIIDASLVDDSTEGVQRFLAVGRSATVLVKERDDGSFYLRTNGLPEATVRRIGMPPVRHSQRWLAALPMTARPEARSMLVVGLGGGVAVEDVPDQFDVIDVVELEPQVIAANASYARWRAADPLADERIRLIENDARNALTLTQRQYDIVVSQPSHPWTSGAANLYSREFMQIARSRLTTDGVLLLWINAQFINESLLRSIAATLSSVFPHVRLYRPEPLELMFLASETPLEPERSTLQTRSILTRYPEYFSAAGINVTEDLAACLAATDEGISGLAGNAAVLTDDRNLLATNSSPARGGMTPDELERLLVSFSPFTATTGTEVIGKTAVARLPLDLHYLGSRIALLGFTQTAAQFARHHRDEAAGVYTLAIGLESAGRVTEAARLRETAVQRFPTDADLAFAHLRPRLLETSRELEKSNLPYYVRGLPDSAQAVVLGWRHAAEGDWAAVRSLEPRLAKTIQTDDWYREAMQLRVEWRTRMNAGERATHGREALQLVDRIIALQPSSDLYVLRAAASLALEDPVLFLESASAFSTYEIQQSKESATNLDSVGVRSIRDARRRGFMQAIETRLLPFEENRSAAVLRQLAAFP